MRVLISTLHHVAKTIFTRSSAGGPSLNRLPHGRICHLRRYTPSRRHYQHAPSTLRSAPIEDAILEPALIDGPPKVELRPYQEECIQSVLNYLAKGEKRLGISLATGSGKTVIFSHLIDRVIPPTQDATQTLILAHRQELVDQAAAHCRKLYPNKTVDIEMAKKRASGLADITVASVATLSRSPERLMRFDPARFKLVLVDEAHHIVASSYADVLKHFQLAISGGRGHTALVGVSATFSRHDGQKLGAAIDHIVYHKDYVEMIEGQWLSNVSFTTVRTGVNLSKVKEVRGDFQTGALSQAVNNEETNLITVRAWLEKAGTRKSTLVFCVDLAHVASLTGMFRRHGIDARFITGDTPPAERLDRLDAFKAGKYPVLLNCGIFTEGTDIPNIDCVLLARPTQSRNLLIQMIGRGLRKSVGKQNCHVIDMVASLEAGIVTTPTLFGLEPDALVDDADFKQMKTLSERKEQEKKRIEQSVVEAGVPPPALTRDMTFTHYDDVNDLIQDTSGERHIRAISRFAWVQIDENKYVLANREGAYITIKQGDANDENANYQLTYTAKLPPGISSKSPFARNRNLGTAETFEGAVHAADKFASERFPHDFIITSAFWRRTAASAAQIEFLNKYRSDEEKLDVGEKSITKGRAMDWITKFRHGARGRFNRMLGQKKQMQKKVQKREKFNEKLKKQEVAVGRVVD